MSKPILSNTRTPRFRPEETPVLGGLFRNFSPAWAACIPLVAVICVVWSTAASAQDVATVDDVVYVQGVLSAIWIVVASVLVIFMNAGFGMLEAGFCRQKNAVNILSKNLIVFALATLAYWSIGYSIMFAGSNPFIGGGGWFLTGANETYGLDPFPIGLPNEVFFLFQVAFAATAATIVSGAVAERIKFIDFVVFSLLLTGISYPITGHWVWSGSGWLGGAGFHDFAGSTVVHSVGGWAALVGAAILGPREGKYVNGRTNAIPGHNMGFAFLGCLILWIGWFGFNPGSELAADEYVPFIAVTTNIAAAAGGASATLTSWLKDGKPDLSMIINGILAGLVGITAGCYVVNFFGAFLIGLIAGVIVVFSVAFFDSIKIDDPVGAISVHLVNGAWGTLAVGIFADPNNFPQGGGEGAIAGILYGNFGQIGPQILGIVSIGAFTVIFSVIAWTIIKTIFGMRVTPEEEILGLDISEHGMEAYSGFVKESEEVIGSAAVSGMASEETM
ncbi:MAG: ammonium transporter [Cyanobacteria bacterium P01_H01_bin.15]